MKITINVKPNTFRKFEDPNGIQQMVKHIFYVAVNDVPANIPMDTNPREQNLKSTVAESITESLTSNDGLFHLKNRGIILSAKKVSYNNERFLATLDFDDGYTYGNLDGGHTYKVILNNQDKILDKQFVQFEVMSGIESFVDDLAEARNNSIAVDAKSMAELRDNFDPIKEGIEGMPFYPRIAFKQNQLFVDPTTGKKQKMIDAREIVAIVAMFNIAKYDNNTHPIQAYSSKAGMLQHYLDDYASYKKFINIMPDIFDLYECIETEFAYAYNTSGGKYGRKKYSGYKKDENNNAKVIGKSKFRLSDIYYKVPDGLIYPVVAAFRALVQYDSTNEVYKWVDGVSPINVWEKCKVDLAQKVMNFANAIGDNPNAVGKDDNIWALAYMTVQLAIK